MKKMMLKLYLVLQALREEHGQDLIEYVLIGGIVAVGAVAGMGTLAQDLNAAFGSLGNQLTSYAG